MAVPTKDACTRSRSFVAGYRFQKIGSRAFSGECRIAVELPVHPRIHRLVQPRLVELRQRFDPQRRRHRRPAKA
jgi:hypothetical protein